jgi:hypothetical protein
MRSPCRVCTESVWTLLRCIRVRGVCTDSTRTPHSLHGVHKDIWGSVKYCKNAAQHSDLIVKTQHPRHTSKEVAAERQAKENVKREKALTKAANIKHIADYEIAQANKDALDATPKAIPE